MIKKKTLHSSQGFDQIGPIKNKNQTQLKFLVEIIYQLIDTYFFLGNFKYFGCWFLTSPISPRLRNQFQVVRSVTESEPNLCRAEITTCKPR